MADEITLELSARDTTGKAVKHLRKDGVVPAVIHDHGKESIVVQGDFVAVNKVVKKAGRNRIVSLKADGKNYDALIRSVDIDPKKHTVRHIVFNAVKSDEKVDAEVPVRIAFAVGNEASPAERGGLVVLEQLETVEVEALPKNLPNELIVDGEKLIEVGDQLTVADIVAVPGVTIKTEAHHVIATVFEPSALQAANDAVGGDAEESAPVEVAAEGTEAAAEEPKKDSK